MIRVAAEGIETVILDHGQVKRQAAVVQEAEERDWF